AYPPACDVCYLHSFPTRRSSDLAVAERCGHQGGIVHSRLILGNLYHDLGFFDLAGQWYRGVVPGLEPLGSPRATTESYASIARRSEEHTSELQSRVDLVCRLLLE